MSINKKTGQGSIRFNQKESLFTRVSNIIWPYVVGTIATYGLIEFILQSNGL